MDATTLPDAVLQTLRASIVRTTTGDAYDPATQLGAIEVGFDVLPPDAALPYVVVDEPGERKTFMTPGPDPPGVRYFLADGSLSVRCYAADRDSPLADQVVAALEDAPLAWRGGTMVGIWGLVRRRAAVLDEGPEGSATIFLTILQFQFQYQGTT